MFQDGISDIFDDVTNRFMFGDWRLLHILAFNMSPLVLGEFILELNNQMREKEELEIPENDSNANLAHNNTPGIAVFDVVPQPA